MAYYAFYDHAKSSRKESQKEAYENLKKSLMEKDENEKLNPFTGAYFHMLDMERRIEKQEKELSKYRDFFSSLKDLLPESFL